MIVLGSDHGGYDLKQQVISYLKENEIEYIDLGCYSKDSVDYPVYADEVCKSITEGKADRGILICTTGIGISIAANRHKGIRAALCHDVYSAEMTRLHNNANILCMGANVIGQGPAISVLKTFLNTEFSGEEKHVRRVDMLH